MNTNTKEIQKHIDQIAAEIEGLTIHTDTQYQQAASFLRDRIKPAMKDVKDTFEPERKEKHEAYKEVTDAIKNYMSRLERVERSVKKMLSDWVTEQERIKRAEQLRLQREAEEKRLQEAVETGDEQSLDEPFIPDVAPAVEKEEGVSYVETWKFEIMNAAAVPEKYKIIDESKIRKIVQAMKADTDIPGIRVYAEKQVRVRA